jgi:hypothetical protein
LDIFETAFLLEFPKYLYKNGISLGRYVHFMNNGSFLLINILGALKIIPGTGTGTIDADAKIPALP